MINHKKTVTSVAFLLLGLGGLHAQETVASTGGEATGTGGTSSYTVGQVVYNTNTGINGSVAQGVQQPYEISTMVGIDETTIQLELSVYPNPTTNYLTLKVADFQSSALTFQLYDMQGKVIENQRVKSNTTSINVENLSTATYFLRVSDTKQIVKTFKIIKQ